MTESELREKIAGLVENESSEAHLRSKNRRRLRRIRDIQKSDGLLHIINYGNHATHRRYIDWGFDGRTLLHTGKYIKYPRVYLKTPNAPGQRAFLRCAASFFLEIRQYSCEKMSCATQKSLAAGHIMSFQIHPKNSRSQSWIKLETSRRIRSCRNAPAKGNFYRRLFDYIVMTNCQLSLAKGCKVEKKL